MFQPHLGQLHPGDLRVLGGWLSRPPLDERADCERAGAGMHYYSERSRAATHFSY